MRCRKLNFNLLSAITLCIGLFSATTLKSDIITNEDWISMGANGMNGEVYALACDSSGNLYAGGAFATAGGVPANRIAKWNGTSWSVLSTGMDGNVTALACDSSGNLYAGGAFTIAGGVTVNYIAKWNGASWSALSTGMNGEVYALACNSSGNLYAGGIFTTAGGGSASRIAKWDGTSWSALGPGMNKIVYALACDSSGNLYAGGKFATTGDQGLTLNYIAKWDGARWWPLGTGMSGSIYYYVQSLACDSSGNLYVGGNFTTAGGLNYIAKWNGTSWSAIGNLVPGMNKYVYALACTSSGDLYAGGNFTTAGEISANSVARWDGTEHTWSKVGNGMGGEPFYTTSISSLACDSSGNLCAGGIFNGLPYSCIAKWNGTQWSPLQRIDNNVSALAFDSSGNLYAGGNFTTAGGVTVNGIAKWNGTKWSALGTGMNSCDVRALACAPSGNLYAGGTFITAGGVTVNYVAKWDGTSWSALGGGITNFVYTLTCDSSGNLYAGGTFTTAGGVSANRIAKWNGASWSPLGTGMGGDVYALAFDKSGNLYAGGNFTTAGGVTVNGIAKWNGTKWSALGTGIGGTSYNVYALTCDSSGNLYAGGTFTAAGGVTVNYIARWDGTSWSALGTGMDSDVYTLASDSSGNLYSGGIFTTAGDKPSLCIARCRLIKNTVTFQTDGTSGATISGTNPQTVSWQCSPVTAVPPANWNFINWTKNGVEYSRQNPLLASDVTAPTTITANFSITTHTINAIAGGNGLITPSGVVAVNHGANQSFTITPNTGYHVADVLVDSVSKGAVASYIFSNVTVNHTISATFAVNTGNYSISGTVSGAVQAGVTINLTGASSASTTTAAEGTYALSSLANGNYTVTPVMAGYTFNPTSLSITISGANATGKNFTATSVGVSYSISGMVSGAVQAGVTINLTGASSASTTTAAGGTYTLSGLANGNYTVTPVMAGYTFTPTTKSVTVSGINVFGCDFTAQSTQTLHAITAFTIPNQKGSTVINEVVHTITVIMPFGTNVSALVPTITIEGASVSPLSGVANNFTSPQTYTVTAVNATTQGYIVTAPVNNGIIAFAKPNGTIEPLGAVDMDTGTDKTFTIKPDTGYHIADVLVDTVSKGEVASYTFSNVIANHTITATFAVDVGTYYISGTVSGAVQQGVTLTLSGAASSKITSGADGAFTFTASNGSYTVTPSLSGYTFTPSSRNIAISGKDVNGCDFVATKNTGIYSISGTVGGAIQEGVTITLSDALSSTTLSGADGKYSFTGLADGDYTVTPELSGYSFTPFSKDATITGADQLDVNFTATTMSIYGTISKSSFNASHKESAKKINGTNVQYSTDKFTIQATIQLPEAFDLTAIGEDTGFTFDFGFYSFSDILGNATKKKLNGAKGGSATFKITGDDKIKGKTITVEKVDLRWDKKKKLTIKITGTPISNSNTNVLDLSGSGDSTSITGKIDTFTLTFNSAGAGFDKVLPLLAFTGKKKTSYVKGNVSMKTFTLVNWSAKGKK